MPTVLLLDVSLSMSRPVPSSDSTENHTRHTIASAAINTFLDYLTDHIKLEYVALLTFSSVCEVAVPFTREYDNIRAKLLNIEDGDKTCIETALLVVNQLVLNDWGYQTPVHIVIVTDGSCGVGAIGRNRILQALPLPPTYPVRIHILPVAAPHDPNLQQAMLLYQKIVEMAGNTNSSTGNITRGGIYCPDQLNVPGVITAMNKLCEQQYQEFWCTLKCGQLETRVQLFPAPQPTSHEGLAATYTISNQLHVIGFMSQQDLGTPIAVSKHLVIPQAQTSNTNTPRENYGSKTPTKEGSGTDGSTDEDMSDPSKVPNFCVLLHGALKVEGMAAVLQLGPDWWGSLSAWCHMSRARRSWLLLSIMTPGASAAPWLGPLDQLGPADESSAAAAETFPVRSWRSYSGGGSSCAWARPHALLADVQKVLRHARKLPDKTQHLYKELNRLRRAAISLGFSELLTCVGGALERECASLPPGAPPEVALQLAHAAAALRDPRTALDIKHTLQPLTSNFSVTSMTH
ncbi:integrator complex subunit 14 isoform X6 [Leptidea sinapis]|uniref:integrator complex subunit 14 isoform X5 n=1 Tax=Leptidea sinapis TaxID=189913 RepID=UPI0021C4C5A9|nr:integrator complex subunit 14 isoform X5 [Leptidea sinapis]XP_050673339.1 integrator complex subunit 14 isoform X6 [Leptidea sinapis]